MKSPMELMRSQSGRAANRAYSTGAGRSSSPKGMTLVEIMIVITLLASIMGVVGFYVFGTLNRAQSKNAGLAIDSLKQKVDMYYIENNQLPDSLNELTEEPNPYIKDESKLKDPWGNQFIYEKKGAQNYSILSPGPDGSRGTEDDIKMGGDS